MAKRGKLRKQVCVPKCCQQPRSHGSKPRTDFSLYFSNSASYINSPSRGGSRLELLRGKDNVSSVTTTSMERHSHALLSRHDEMPEFTLVQCNMSPDGGNGGIFSNSIGMTSTESGSQQEEPLDSCNNRINVQNKSDDGAVLFCSPNKSTSQVTECSDVQATPGTVMWARTAHQMWWPAKILEGRSSPVATNDQGADGQVLVQYYGNHELAWVDPARDLSDFDEFFEERSCNPMEAFQDALKQALHKTEDLDSCRQMDRSPDRLKNLSQHEQSVAKSNKWIESSSSREDDGYLERGRGKRKRKPKLHFDEVTFPNKSMKKMRRFRIMRFLGLTAPIGSPFSLTTGVRNC